MRAPLSPRRGPWARLAGGAGLTGIFLGSFAFVPEKKIGIAMLSNRGLPGSARITAALPILDQLASKP